MVQALIQLHENTNKVLNIIKAKHGLRDKGETIEFVIKEYVEMENEPELKLSFVEKMKHIEKQKSIRVKDFAKRYELN